jgi:Ni,Fe-hydrogenase I small subunit
MLGVALQYATDGTFPETDEEKRPKFAFDCNIHEHCPRRAHFDVGNFVKVYGDDGHPEGVARVLWIRISAVQSRSRMSTRGQESLQWQRAR